MKKTLIVISILLSLSLCMGSLASCGDNKSSDKTGTSSSVAAKVDLEDVYAKITDKVSFPTMYTMTDDYIESYFGLTSDKMEDKLFASAEDALLADTIAIVKVAEGTSTKEIEKTFTRVNDQKKLELESYNPEQYARVDKAVIKTVGEYVCYIISDDNDAVINVIESNLA